MPSILDLLHASGLSVSDVGAFQRAAATLYGHVGVNIDDRNWTEILAMPDPLSAAEAALRAQWLDSAWRLRNAEWLVSRGYALYAPEMTYRDMAVRLGVEYVPLWAKGTRFEAASRMTDDQLALGANDDAVPPTLGLRVSSSGASLIPGREGVLSYSVAGTPEAVLSIPKLLEPAGAVREGFFTLTRPSGAAGVSTFYVLIGTHTAIDRTFISDAAVRNRLIVLGSGNDTVRAGHGHDTVYGGGGDDVLSGNQGDDLMYGGTGADTLEGGAGSDTMDGGSGDDALWGGTVGADRLTGGAGADQFRFFNTNSGVTVADLSFAAGDTLAFLDGNGTGGSVAFDGVGTGAGAALNATDFDAVASVQDVRHDTGGAGSGSNQVYVITSTQTSAQIAAAVTTGAANAYVLVYDSTQGAAQLWFDVDWGTATGRTGVATLTGLSAADVAAMVITNFKLWVS